MARLDDTRQTFDYDKLLTISTGWNGCIYCLSQETAYLAALNLERFTQWRNRWSHTNGDPLTDEEWDITQGLVAQGVYELMAGCDTLGADIRAGLETLALAIQSSGGGSGGGCFPQNSVVECVINLPNEELLGPGEYEQGNPLEDPPPDGFATWEEYFTYKCQAANFIWWLERKHMVNLRSFEGVAAVASLLGPSVAGLAGLLPAAFTPAGFAVFIASIVAIGLLSLTSWFFMDEMIQWWDDNREAIVCALYDSGTSVGAVAALGNFLEDAIQAIVTWGALEAVAGAIAELLGTAFSQLAGNGIVAPLFAATASVVSVEGAIDCAVCEPEPEVFAQTSQESPYNVLVVGDAITSHEESAANGYAGQNNGTYVDLAFTPGDYSGLWEFQVEVAPAGALERTLTLQLQEDAGEGWFNVGPLWSYGPYTGDAVFHLVGETDLDIDFVATSQYRLHCAPADFNLFGWYRAFDVRSIP